MHWRRKWHPLQCSCLENPRDGGARCAAIYGVAHSQTRLKWLSSSSSSLHTQQILGTWIKKLINNCFPTVQVKVAQLCLTLCHPMDYTAHGVLQVRMLGVGCHFLLQGMFPTQESNPGLPHCRRILYQMSPREVVFHLTFFFISHLTFILFPMSIVLLASSWNSYIFLKATYTHTHIKNVKNILSSFLVMLPKATTWAPRNGV